MNEKILIIDDEQDICTLIKGLLEDEGYQTLTASNSQQGYDLIERELPDLIIQDIWLQGSDDDGIEILKNVKEARPYLPFIMISGHGTIETAVSAIKIGAYDFIEKPFNSDRLLLMIHRALENAELKKQNAKLKQSTTDKTEHGAKQIPEYIRQVLDKTAKTNSRLLITGEPGSGKNISAQYVHEYSERSSMPFMVLNCVSTDPEKLDCELFGTCGGYAGQEAKIGLLELVDGGTLLLDEVIDLPIETQGKILSLLQENAYCKVGSNDKIPVDVRVIATTNADIEQYLENGRFRKDLYYRLNVVPIDMPSLKQRKQDIPTLIQYFSTLSFSQAAITRLQSYHWPGNIKQLHNVLEWISIMHENNGELIDVHHLPPELNGSSSALQNHEEVNGSNLIDDMLDMRLREARECFERHYLLSQVNKFDGNISKTAAFIGMERSALHRKLKTLDVFSDDKQNVA